MSLIRYQTPELSTWSPFVGLSTLRDEMNRLFDLTRRRDSAPRRIGCWAVESAPGYIPGQGQRVREVRASGHEERGHRDLPQ